MIRPPDTAAPDTEAAPFNESVSSSLNSYVQPNMHHLLALQELADGMGPGHLLPTAKVRLRS